MKANPSTPHPSPDTREAAFYAELLAKAHEEGLTSIRTQLLAQPMEDNGQRCIAKAVIETSKGTFEGIGDADPTSVEDFLIPHLIRVAETRAKARALRDAVNCGVVSFEELDGVGTSPRSGPEAGAPPRSPGRRTASAPRPRSTRGNGTAPMSEAQRRYLFRLMAGQGYQGEEAETRLRDLFEVSDLTGITKAAATRMIDELLQTSAPARGGGNGRAARAQR